MKYLTSFYILLGVIFIIALVVMGTKLGSILWAFLKIVLIIDVSIIILGTLILGGLCLYGKYLDKKNK